MNKVLQHDQVIETMKRNGGFATLGSLYQNVDVSDWKSKTPFKSINRIVQDDRFFFRIRPGLWALNEERQSVLEKLSIQKETNQPDFNHSYYQGLLLEIGNLKGHQTFVPNQDKNKIFLNKPLKEISSLDKVLSFGYPSFVKRAQTVDVIWFNDRDMPTAFFEVEHSTDIYNSLLKFSDLRDFYSTFCIVADAARRREYEGKIATLSFKEIKDRVTFLDYETVSKVHSSAHKLNKSKGDYSFL